MITRLKHVIHAVKMLAACKTSRKIGEPFLYIKSVEYRDLTATQGIVTHR